MSAQELSESTKVRLLAYQGRFNEIAQRFGIGLSWLSKFANGRMENPTVGSLQSLIDALDVLDDEKPVDGPKTINTPEAVERLLGVSRATEVASPAPAPTPEPEPVVEGDSRVVPFEAPP